MSAGCCAAGMRGVRPTIERISNGIRIVTVSEKAGVPSDPSHSQHFVDRLDVRLDLSISASVVITREGRSEHASRHGEGIALSSDGKEISGIDDLTAKWIGNLLLAAANRQHRSTGGAAQVQRSEATAGSKTFRLDSNCDRLAQSGHDGVCKLQPFRVGLRQLLGRGHLMRVGLRDYLCARSSVTLEIGCVPPQSQEENERQQV